MRGSACVWEGAGGAARERIEGSRARVCVRGVVCPSGRCRVLDAFYDILSRYRHTIQVRYRHGTGVDQAMV